MVHYYKFGILNDVTYHVATLQATENPQVYFEIEISCGPSGKIEFEYKLSGRTLIVYGS